MSDVQSLLPRNGTAFLRAIEQAIAYDPRLAPGIDLIPNIKGRRLPDFLQFLLYEYGLIQLTPYVPGAYELLDEGRVWQIERDTFAAVARGLGWVGYGAVIEEAPVRRAWWNSFQLRFPTLPATDTPDLDRIDRITSLSKPFRSDFRRGVFEYDAPALEADYGRADGVLAETESGVRLRTDGPLWSFGRTLTYGHTLTQEEGDALGHYLVPTGEQTILIDFLTGEAMIGDVPVDLPEAFSLSRASAKTATTLAGAVEDFAVDEMAITDAGLLYEAAGQNAFAYAEGADGLVFDASRNGLTAEIVGTGTTDGIAWVDLRLFGDATERTGHYVAFGPDLPATAGDWTVSAYLAIVGGSLAGIEGFSLSGVDISALGATMTRVSASGTFAAGAILSPGIQIGYAIGSAVDLTIRIGARQIENRATASSLIRTAGEAASRATDIGVVHLPPGLHYLTVTFDDDSEQGFDGLVGDFTIPAASLARPRIKKVQAVQLEGFESLRWVDVQFPWADANFPWVSPGGNARRIFLASWFDSREAYLVLKDADGAVIGYRRPRAIRQVNPAADGPYNFSGVPYAPSVTGEFVVIDTMTAAGDGAGREAASISLLFNATRLAGVPAGRLWLEPGQLSGGVEIAPLVHSIPLRATVRERIKLLLRF